MRLVSVEEMKSIEAEANASGLSYAAMMQNAGRGLAEIIQNAYSHSPTLQLLGLVGSGNNGGDTLIALTYLAHNGWQATAYLASPRNPDDELLKHFSAEGGQIISCQDETAMLILDKELSQASIILDGILGTGFKLPLREDIAGLLNHIKTILCEKLQKTHIIAVDCPSGIDCDSGQASEACLKAECTVCMAAVKSGLMTYSAASLCGDFVVVDIGLPAGLPTWEAARDRISDDDLLKSLIPPRANDAHKGTFGTAMIAAGSLNYPGAVLLAAEAAYRIGAGLVTAAIPQPLFTALAGHLPECTWVSLPHLAGSMSSKGAERLLDSLKGVTALLIGPGLGLSSSAQGFIQTLLGVEIDSQSSTIDMNKPEILPPMVIDADGLKLLSRIPEWPQLLPQGSILTPHPGEMAALTGLSIQQIQTRRMETAREWAIKWKQVVILKGAYTVIASPMGRVTINPLATAALARAGTGDVLAGMVVGLLAQGIPAEDAAVAATGLHGKAALAALDAVGSAASVLAGNVSNMIGPALHNLGR